MAKPLEIQRVLDLDKWTALQEKIALATDLALVLVDYRGKPLTPHSQVKPFCRLARAHPELAVYCEKCDARGALEAVRTEKPFIYRCHFDIIDMAIPIMVEEHYVGAIMAGELLVYEHQSDYEQVLKLDDLPEIGSFKTAHEELLADYPHFEPEQLERIAAMLAQLSEYIVTEAVKKEELLQHCQENVAGNQTWMTQNVPAETVLAPPQSEVTQVESLVQRFGENGIYQAQNHQLQPAIDAVFANRGEHLDLGYLARQVNLSPPYLSRLLRIEFGEPFSRVYAKLKIYWGKELLTQSDLSVAEISDTLGFVEPSYFIRSFKKITGTTPLKWRQGQRP